MISHQNYHNDLSYVLITPARNEEAYIQLTIQSVISQTVLPRKWIIISDGSTDQTDEIVKKYLPENGWMELIRLPERKERHFAGKVNCFNAGYQKLNDMQYDIVGNLDADISFEKDYFEFLMEKFADNPKLGVCGTPFVEEGTHYDYRFTNIDHVSGACQMFRRECFEEIGGYIPVKGGGIDWIAVTTARMKGWTTRTFTEKTCIHHRKIGTGITSAKNIWFIQGQKDYLLGNHPLWEIFRAIYQTKKNPRGFGGILLLMGYLWSLLHNIELVASKELTSFIRMEQMHRLRRLFMVNIRRPGIVK